jgi:hypothetical protein
MKPIKVCVAENLWMQSCTAVGDTGQQWVSDCSAGMSAVPEQHAPTDHVSLSLNGGHEAVKVRCEALIVLDMSACGTATMLGWLNRLGVASLTTAAHDILPVIGMT